MSQHRLTGLTPGGKVDVLLGVSLDMGNYCTVRLFFEQAYL